MKVLLTHGYFLEEDAKEQRLMRPYPPLGILYLAAYLDEHGADVIVVGEGEETMHALVGAWSDGGDLAGIPGIVFRDGEGRVVRTEPRPLLKNLDDLPMPKRDALELRPYLEAWRNAHGQN